MFASFIAANCHCSDSRHRLRVNRIDNSYNQITRGPVADCGSELYQLRTGRGPLSPLRPLSGPGGGPPSWQEPSSCRALDSEQLVYSMSYMPSSLSVGPLGAPGAGENPGDPLGPLAQRGPLEPLRSQPSPPLFEMGCGIGGIGGIGFGLGVTVDWQQLAGVSYRRQSIFSMLWESPRVLENSVVAATPWGGPIAAVRSEKVFQPATNKLMPELQVLSQSHLNII